MINKTLTKKGATLEVSVRLYIEFRLRQNFAFSREKISTMAVRPILRSGL